MHSIYYSFTLTYKIIIKIKIENESKFSTKIEIRERNIQISYNILHVYLFHELTTHSNLLKHLVPTKCF